MKLEGRKSEIESRRVFFLAFGLVVSLGVALYLEFHAQINNEKFEKIVNLIVTVFSIFGGFLVTILSTTSAPLLRSAKNSKDLPAKAIEADKKLLRYNLLFYLYAITIIIAIGCIALDLVQIKCATVIRCIFYFLSSFSLLVTLSLPSIFRQMQIESFTEN